MDLLLLHFLNQTLAHPILDLVMIGLTVLGFALLPGVGILMLLIEAQHRWGRAVLLSLLSSLALTLVFQYLAFRARPETVRLLLETPNFPAYPSGHAAAAFGVAVILGLAHRQLRWWSLSLGGASLIALSRVYLGHHYPSDIFGGAVLGMAIGAACYGLVGLPQANWRWLLWPQVALAILVTQMAYLDLLPLYLLRWPGADKLLHFLLFGAIAFWLNLWLEGQQIRWGRWAIPLAIGLPLTVAFVEEGFQALSPLRTADVTDLASDLAGLIFFWGLSHWVLRFTSKEAPVESLA